MNATANIGKTICIKGEVTSQEPLTIAGRVDGSVEVSGHGLTIVEGGEAIATLLATTIEVSGAVHGSVRAIERIVVADSAVVEGDLTAPSLSLADGARVHGRIDAAGRRTKEMHLAS